MDAISIKILVMTNNIKNQLPTMKMKTIGNLNDSTYEIRKKKYKIDHFINIKHGKYNLIAPFQMTNLYL